jgi:hypothetical protein
MAAGRKSQNIHMMLQPRLWLLVTTGLLLRLHTASANLGFGPPAVLMSDWNIQLNVTWNQSSHFITGALNYILDSNDITAGQVSTLNSNGAITICYVR